MGASKNSIPAPAQPRPRAEAHSRRKVIRQGNDTLTLTLPRKWTSQMGIRGGDELDVEERGPVLTVTAHGTPGMETVRIDAEEAGVLFKRILTYLYRTGYDEVMVTFRAPGVVNRIQDIIAHTLMGFEIVAQGPGYCVIRNISVPVEAELDSLLRRTFLLLQSMAEGVNTQLAHPEALQDLRRLEDTNNKFTTICRRILVTRGYRDPLQTARVYSLTTDLELLADEYKYLIDYAIQQKGISPSPPVLAYLQDVGRMATKLYDLLFSFSLPGALEGYQQRKDLIDRGLRLLPTKTGDNVVVVHYALRIAHIGFNIMCHCLAVNYPRHGLGKA
ncbi:MAG: hypothetical protein HY520_03760 [Candidatus Aenigmarchaeota archaeon]|nr:hypothetical protein [Candidatus Aenigmarchaeota archaeon]